MYASGIAKSVVNYIEPAESVDVMYDQLDYLTQHATKCSSPICSDCVRLRRVKDLLMLPFAKVTYVGAVGSGQ